MKRNPHLSKDRLEWEEKQKVKETWYDTKTIQLFGRSTPIILQNENGPCPLLAICNILLLRNKLGLSTDVTQVSERRLVELVGDYIYDIRDKVENKQTLIDVLDMLPALTMGLGVNVKFTRIDDIEFTRECAVFGLLEIPVYHGWLIDPQDTRTSGAIGFKSYDTLMSDLVDVEYRMNNAVEDQIEIVETEHVGEKHEPLMGLELTRTVQLSSANLDDQVTFITGPDKASQDGKMNASKLEKHESKDGTKNTSIEAVKKPEKSKGDCSSPRVGQKNRRVTFGPSPDKGSHDVQKNASEPEKHESKNGTEKTSIEAVKKTEKSKSDCSSLRIGNKDTRVIFGQTISTKTGSSASNVVPESSTETTETKSRPLTARQGKRVRDFLKNNASQLTEYGLFCLHEGLKDNKFCVLFRNNHFNTMLKHENTLYMLVTDLGYKDQPGVVWEKLSEVNGDTVYVNEKFEIYRPETDICRRDEESLKIKNDACLDKIDDTTAEASTSTNKTDDTTAEASTSTKKIDDTAAEASASTNLISHLLLDEDLKQLASKAKQRKKESEEAQSQHAKTFQELVSKAKKWKQEEEKQSQKEEEEKQLQKEEEKQSQRVSPVHSPIVSNVDPEDNTRPRNPPRRCKKKSKRSKEKEKKKGKCNMM